MVFSSFNIEGNSRCSKDYLKVSGPIKKYRAAKMCGSSVISSYYFEKLNTSLFFEDTLQLPTTIQEEENDCELCFKRL